MPICFKESNMPDDLNKETGSVGALSLPTCSDLRGRQSIRATFKLSEQSIEIISVVASRLGIKQKSLFDHLIDDIDSLRHIARDYEQDEFHGLDRVQKTYVLSRKTLTSLEEVAKKFDAPRDALVEYSIKRLIPVVEEERERHSKRKEVLTEIAEFLGNAKEILNKSRELLGEDDFVYERLEASIKGVLNAYNSIAAFVEKGEMIEDF
jgi:hypothetical protein